MFFLLNTINNPACFDRFSHPQLICSKIRIMWFSALYVALLIAFTNCSRPTIIEVERRQLLLGETKTRSLSKDESHYYHFPLDSGTFIAFDALSDGMDANLSLFDPEGEVQFSTTIAKDNSASLQVFISVQSGDHYIKVSSTVDTDPGSYQIVLTTLRKANAADRNLVAAFRTMERANAFYKNRNFEGAAHAYQLAVKGWQKVKNLKEQGMALRGLSLSYEKLNKPNKAIKHLDRAIETFTKLKAYWQLMRLYNYRGRIEWKMGRHTLALSSYWEAFKLAKITGDRYWEALILNGLGAIFYFQGASENALAFYQKALPIWEEIGAHRPAATTWLNIGMVYRILGLNDEALMSLDRALAGFQSSKDLNGEIKAIIQLGAIHTNLANFEKALRIFQVAYGKIGLAQEPRLQAVLLDQYGNLLWRLERYEEAETLYLEALHLFEMGNFQRDRAYTAANLIQTLLSMGRVEQAMHYFEGILAHFLDKEDPLAVVHIYYLLAKGLQLQGDLEAARGCIEESFRLVEGIREETKRATFRVFSLQSRYHYYELYIDILMDLNQHFPDAAYDVLALETSDQIRARDFLSSLETPLGGPEEKLSPELQKRVDELQRELNRKGRQHLLTQTDDSKHDDLKNIIRRYQEISDEVIAQTVTESTSAPVTLMRIQREILDRDTLLLMYALGKKRSFVWLVGPENLESHVLPGRFEIERLVEEYHRLLAQSYKQSKLLKARLTAEKLSQWLVGPVYSKMIGKRIIIVNDGALHLLPFGSLPIPTSQTRQLTYLVEKNEIVVLPSVSTLMALRTRQNQRPLSRKGLAILADPVFHKTDSRVKCETTGGLDSNVLSGVNSSLRRVSREMELTHLPRLNHTRREARAVMALAPGSENIEVLDFDANRENVKQWDFSSYQILHFATHGLLHPKYAELSGIILSLVDVQGRPVDGFLRTHEIRKLNLPVELVVLSACKTAIGTEIRGEGVMGLSRAFMDAGATRVLVTLWSVDDEATAELMALFYRSMFQDGLSPSASLREAQSIMRHSNKRQAPYYWAGFVLQGEW